MTYLKKIYRLIDNYLIARLQNRPSTALFWYLPEPSNIKTQDDLLAYQTPTTVAPFYPIDYRQKLKFSLKNKDDIIVLPYDPPIGPQLNPEAAFQYALALHDANQLDSFFKYADYFVKKQTIEGLWNYEFDWFGSKAPWHSALAQARGSSVMLRAWLHSKDNKYYESAKKALAYFSLATDQGGFLHPFSLENCFYFEEYPKTPTGVINGFMAALISIWELKYWMKEKWLEDLWQLGIHSLPKMLPHYSIGWWSLYDRDDHSPVPNVNSPRYHLLELQYLQVLYFLSNSTTIQKVYEKRVKQYKNFFYRTNAFALKVLRKTLYR